MKNQFKYNTTLATALSDQVVTGDVNSLATVLSEHFADVVTPLSEVS